MALDNDNKLYISEPIIAYITTNYLEATVKHSDDYSILSHTCLHVKCYYQGHDIYPIFTKHFAFTVSSLV